MKDRPIPRIIAKAMYRMHRPERLKVEMKLLESGIIKTGDQVIDIGCGPGHLSQKMALLTGEKGRVFALDIHPLAMDSIRRIIEEKKFANIQGILTADFMTGLVRESVDCAFLFNTIGMVRNKGRLTDELNRILRPGALVVIYNKKSLRFINRDYADLFAGTDIGFLRREGRAIFYKKNKEVSHE